MIEYKMTPSEYFKKIIELYHQSREPEYYNPNIKRGRSSSISSRLEDLTALFIALNNPNNCKYYTDQPIKFEGSTTKYPDIVIQEESLEIKNLIDVKTDIGWNREGMFAFCSEWENRIEKIKGTKTKFRQGSNKELIEGLFSKKLKYHILVISKINSGKTIEIDYKKVISTMKNVSLYILSDEIHPNNYELSIQETLMNIKINEPEIERLLLAIIKV
jgi:hypothetical protein